MEAGVYVSIDPDTFVLSAWMSNAHGRDRTGGERVARGERSARHEAATADRQGVGLQGFALVAQSDGNEIVWSHWECFLFLRGD
jgi:hypothetical protein